MFFWIFSSDDIDPDNNLVDKNDTLRKNERIKENKNEEKRFENDENKEKQNPKENQKNQQDNVEDKPLMDNTLAFAENEELEEWINSNQRSDSRVSNIVILFTM